MGFTVLNAGACGWVLWGRRVEESGVAHGATLLCDVSKSLLLPSAKLARPRCSFASVAFIGISPAAIGLPPAVANGVVVFNRTGDGGKRDAASLLAESAGAVSGRPRLHFFLATRGCTVRLQRVVNNNCRWLMSRLLLNRGHVLPTLES